MHLLAVTAVAAEADAVVRDLGATGATTLGPYDARLVSVVAGRLTVVAADAIGPAAAAAATATALACAGSAYDLVLSVGVAGAFPRNGVEPGDVVIATRIVAADVGVRTAEGFLDAQQIGFASGSVEPVPAMVKELQRRLEDARIRAHAGDILTVSTMTGTDVDAGELAVHYPEARAEAMEGAGVAHAATRFGCDVVEVRAISNLVGPRDRAAWHLDEALETLSRAMPAIVAEPL